MMFEAHFSGGPLCGEVQTLTDPTLDIVLPYLLGDCEVRYRRREPYWTGRCYHYDYVPDAA